MKLLQPLRLVCAMAVASLAACTSSSRSHVRQANAPKADEFAESSDSDMASGPEKGPKPVIKNEAQLRHDCCQECSDALAKDRSGDDPTKIPCKDFTADLKEECLNFFRKQTLMAADAKACAAQAVKAAPKSDDDAQ